MKQFMDKDFLLQTETAQKLYHEHAARMPIIDYHCHLDPAMVADDHRFASLTELWLGGDHYKWRAMRTNGVAERYCTGTDTSDWEKFEKWAETVPYTMRNPLYHWTHLELRTAFGIHKLLSPRTARDIYDECNAKLQTPEYSARNLMRRYRVEVVCTTDDPADSLEHHIRTRQDGFEIKMLPTWRPDKAPGGGRPCRFPRLRGTAGRSGGRVHLHLRRPHGCPCAAATTSSPGRVAACPTTGWAHSTPRTTQRPKSRPHSTRYMADMH